MTKQNENENSISQCPKWQTRSMFFNYIRAWVSKKNFSVNTKCMELRQKLLYSADLFLQPFFLGYTIGLVLCLKMFFHIYSLWCLIILLCKQAFYPQDGNTVDIGHKPWLQWL